MPDVDVEERGSGPEQAGEVAWSPTPVLRRPPGRRDRTTTLLAIAVAAVALAVLKPWGAGFAAPTAPVAVLPSAAAGAESRQPVALPTPRPVIADRNAMTCLTHQVEQVLTLERWPDREIKSWSQPDGPMVTISSSHVVGIGVCPGIGPAGSALPVTSPSREPEVWSGADVTDVRLLEGDVSRDLGAPPQITVETDYVAAAVLFGAPAPAGEASPRPSGGPQPSAPLAAWPAGRYELIYVFPGDPDRVRRTVIVEITTPLNDG